MRQPDSHESYAVAARRLHWIGGVLAVSLAVIVLLMYLLSRTILRTPAQIPPGAAVPPPPRLQTSPEAELAADRKRQAAALKEYRWVDRDAGLARIPVERAMQIMLDEPAATVPPVHLTQRADLSRHADITPRADLTARAGLAQRIGAQIPLDLQFRDADAQPISLGAALAGRPGVLTLGYFRCPNLCPVTLHKLAAEGARMSLRAGVNYAVTFVSIDPGETPADARETRAMLAGMFPQAHVERWHLLTGDARAIQMLAAADGVRFYYDTNIRQYVHPAALSILSPAGRITQYRIGAGYSAESLRLGLIDASQGRLGTIVDQLVLLCCGYDPQTGRYDLLISRVLQILGVCFVAGVLWWIARLRPSTNA